MALAQEVLIIFHVQVVKHLTT